MTSLELVKVLSTVKQSLLYCGPECEDEIHETRDNFLFLTNMRQWYWRL